MRQHLLTSIALILAIAFCAFTKGKNNSRHTTTQEWFVFNGTSPGDLNNPAKYSIDGDGSIPTVCASATKMYRCEVLADPLSGDPSEPDLSTITDQTKRDNP